MLSTARVELPANVAARLKSSAAFNENVTDFAREDLIGFKRPLAATFALVAPVTLSVIYMTSDLFTTAQWGLVMIAMVTIGIGIVSKREWSGIVAAFQARAYEKKRAVADLRCGFGESSFLGNGRCPQFFTYDHGVLVLADAGDLKTLFFDIPRDSADPRWALYERGELDRRVWRWLRLPMSREFISFTTEGSKLAPAHRAPPVIDSLDAWEAINLALGEPLDGAIIHRPFDELTDMVERLVN